MSRRVLSLLVAGLASLTLVATVLAGHRQRSAERDADALRQRATATVKRTAAAEPRREPSARRTKVCPRGAEGLANSARQSIRRKLIGDDGRIDKDALAEMSNIAIAAGRYLEKARAAPALPQRLGRRRKVSAEGLETWEPIPYPKIGCAMVPRAPPAVQDP